MATPALDQDVGGTDLARQLAQVFKDHRAEESEMHRALMDSLTTMHQRMLGDTRRTDPQQQMSTMASMRAAIAGDPNAQANAFGWMGTQARKVFGNPTAGQTKVSPQAQGTAQTPAQTTTAQTTAAQQQVPQGGTMAPPANLGPPPHPQPPGGAGYPQGPGSGSGSGGGGSSGSGGGGGGGGGARPGGSGPPPPPTPPRSPNRPDIDPSAGLVNRLWGMAKGQVPFLGHVEDARAELQSQMNKNNYYRSMEGIGHGSAIAERVREEWTRAAHPIQFNEAEARQAFKESTALGYTHGARGQSQDRGEAIDFLAEGKSKYGASVTEGIQQLAVVSRAANIDLTTLAESLDSLSKTAGQAGVNAEHARAQMTSMLNTAIATGVGGQNAPQLAQSEVETTAALGRGFQHMDTSGQMTNQGFRYMLAGHMNKTLAQVNNLEAHDPAKVQNATTEMLLQGMQAYIQNSDPQAWSFLTNEVQTRKKELEQDSDETSLDIANRFWEQADGLDPNAFVAQANLYTTIPFHGFLDATQKLITEMAGMTAGARTEKMQASVGTTNRKGVAANGLKAVQGKHGLAKGGLASLDKHAMTGGASVFGIKVSDDHEAKATSIYTDRVRKTGRKSGALEAMLQELSPEQQEKQEVRVRTKDGFKVVKLAQAMKYYPGQLRSGEAEMVGGEYAGKDIAAFTGGAVDAKARGKADKEVNQTGAALKGSRDYDPAKDKPKGEKGWTSATLKIDLTDAAKKLITADGTVEDAEGEPRSGINYGSRDNNVALKNARHY